MVYEERVEKQGRSSSLKLVELEFESVCCEPHLLRFMIDLYAAMQKSGFCSWNAEDSMFIIEAM